MKTPNVKIMLLLGIFLAFLFLSSCNDKSSSPLIDFDQNKTKEKGDVSDIKGIPPREVFEIMEMDLDRSMERAIPVRIQIDGKTAPIMPVGLTKDGAMDTVDDAETIAWYEYGATPLEEGNSLLAGHKGWKGTRGTFNELEKLQPGTEIEVTLSDGQKIILELVKTEIHDKDQVPPEIMNVEGRQRTTLITCSGKFIRSEGTHENRVISIFKRKNEERTDK